MTSVLFSENANSEIKIHFPRIFGAFSFFSSFMGKNNTPSPAIWAM